MKRDKTVLEHWIFGQGDAAECLETGREVGARHTWNIEEGMEDYAGAGWYRHELTVPGEWQKKRVWVCFGAVYHDAVIYINGREAARHEHAGYTPFTVELTEFLRFGEKNELTVSVSNRYSEDNLPYMRSFDWSNDGGMIREAYLYTTGAGRIANAFVKAQPVILEIGVRQDRGAACFELKAVLEGTVGREQQLSWEVYEGEEVAGTAVKSGMVTAEGEVVIRQAFEEAAYWHFDNPELYTLRLTLREGKEMQDTVLVRFGFRDFHTQGHRFYLNGEEVRLAGTEWMPGSDPAFGMAESEEQLEKMLVLLKESNCIYTRFHWQQDEFVFDWCDRHGMLVQEEIPFWGGSPSVVGEQQKEVFRQQAAEMISAHYNHPSIIAWGVGNELRAQEQVTIDYIKEAADFVHAMDEHRTANYVSNSYLGEIKQDGTMFGDVIMLNEYCGTWFPDDDAFITVQRMTELCRDRPVVISEFGLCEPTFSGGDEGRSAIFTEKMGVYRQFPQVAGTINFSLNDYRTQMGEQGEGRYRRRVHGSTELDGTRKPSYYVVQRECAPFTVSREGNILLMTCRNDLPCYEMRGYLLEISNEAGLCEKPITVPNLRPGECFRTECESGSKVDVYRKNKDWAGAY